MVKKILYLISAGAIVTVLLNFGSPQVVATLHFSNQTANRIVDVINAYGTASFAVSMVLAITGAGASITAFIAAIYAYAKSKGKKYAVAW